jgi:hypothetical protein
MLVRSLPLRAGQMLFAALGLLASAGLALGAGPETDDDVVKVEEDWELVVGQPDPDTDAPQVTCYISPTGDMTGTFAAFDVNHRSQPSFNGGGLQLQLWHGDQCVQTKSLDSSSKLATSGEVVRWTTRVSIGNGWLKFQIRNGTSTAWGTFGGWSYRVSEESSLATLDNYSSTVSVEQSGVGFAGNRVATLKLLRVRSYKADGSVVEDTQEKVVHTAE